MQNGRVLALPEIPGERYWRGDEMEEGEGVLLGRSVPPSGPLPRWAQKNRAQQSCLFAGAGNVVLR